MAINKDELKAVMDRKGIGGRTQKKILDGLDETVATPQTRTSSGHGAAAPDLTEVPSM